MARQRFIWPDIWKDPIFGKLEPVEQVLFIGFFSIADDEGRLMADPAYLRAEIFPYTDYSNKKVHTIRDRIAEKCPNVHLYRAGDLDIIALLKWPEYQKPKYPKASKLPPPFLQDSPNASGSLPENSSLGWVGLGRDGLDRAGLGSAEHDREERLREVQRMLHVAKDKDGLSEAILMTYALRLPMGAVAKVRESGELSAVPVGAGWFVNALKSEIEAAA